MIGALAGMTARQALTIAGVIISAEGGPRAPGAAARARAAPGLIPRRIAISGRRAIAAANRSFIPSPRISHPFGRKRRRPQPAAWALARMKGSPPLGFLHHFRVMLTRKCGLRLAGAVTRPDTMLRFIPLTLALFSSLAIAGGPTTASAPSAEGLRVNLDQAKIARLPEGTATLVIGNPIVADVTMLKGSGAMVVTGKGV